MKPVSAMPARVWACLLMAWLIALVSTLGALFFSGVMGLEPCVLCWYQRIAMFPLVPILGLSIWRGDRLARVYALPFGIAGLALAAWHSGLYAGLLPAPVVPCTENGPSCSGPAQVILGLPIPYLSLAAFAAILACLILPRGTRA